MQVLLLARGGGLPSSMVLVMKGIKLCQRSLLEHLCVALSKGKVDLGRKSSWDKVYQYLSTLVNIAFQHFFGMLLVVRVFHLTGIALVL